MSDGQALTLLAGDQPGAEIDGKFIWWDRNEAGSEGLSLTGLIERDWKSLRQDYLVWIGAQGRQDCGGEMLRDVLMIDDQVSAWWISLMAEKSPMKTAVPWLVFKLRALELICEDSAVGHLITAGIEPRINKILRDWCVATGREFTETRPATTSKADPVMGRRVRFLPHPLRGLIWLARHWWTRVRIVRANSPSERADRPGADTMIVTYFPNCDQKALADGKFVSNYWQDLHTVLEDREGNCDWVWLYAPSEEISLRDAATHRDHCNAATASQRFFLLEEFATPGVLMQTIKRYLKLVLRSRRAITCCGVTRFPGSNLDLRPVLIEDWKNSFRGIVAAETAWLTSIFEAMAQALPVPETGLYVFENQPWEAALISAWRQAGTNRVIAHQHEAVKPLNLRLFEDMALFNEDGRTAKPLPDILATGSEQAREQLIEGGWPENKVSLVESLRFRNGAPVTQPNPESGSLLVITGYLTPETRTMLRLVAEAEAAGLLAGCDGIIIKPHPFLPVGAIIKELGFERAPAITTEPLDTLWPRAAFAFAANSTAAIFDAIAAGIPTAICAAEDDFNLSPAFGREDIATINDAAALGEAVRAQKIAAPITFCADKSLTRWRALLDGAAPHATKIRQEA